MIKIFGTSQGPELAAEDLNQKFENWKKSFGNNSIEILDFKINSNESGWILVIKYNVLRF